MENKDEEITKVFETEERILNRSFLTFLDEKKQDWLFSRV